MQCPFCNHSVSEVKDSRTTASGVSVRRRRQCLQCNSKFTTYEKVELNQIYVIKKSKAKKPLDINKITNSISTALRKRNITLGQINDIANNVKKQIEGLGANYIDSSKIGSIIMQELAKIDHVGYIRFASVYKDFSSVDDFIQFINKMKTTLIGE
jgi:transcriptional repressor NrdR